jgi:hypothetical protein
VEAWRQLDLGEILFDLLGFLTGLRHFRPIGRAARMAHCT